MPVWRLQCTWQIDSAAPKDKVMITPHFNDIGATTDPQNLCDDMLAGLETIKSTTGEVQVKAYDAQGSIPVYPQGDAIVRKGAVQATTYPRELAVCLSFYGERNVKRQRGRIYVPLFFTTPSSVGLRPDTTQTALESLATLFQGLGGADVDWCVYSRRMDHAYSVTNWWYDNEWDVMRSRGLKGTSRVLGTTSEAGALSEVSLAA
jgi:hypothetical protein